MNDGAEATDPGNHPALPDNKAPTPANQTSRPTNNINDAVGGLSPLMLSLIYKFDSFSLTLFLLVLLMFNRNDDFIGGKFIFDQFQVVCAHFLFEPGDHFLEVCIFSGCLYNFP